jgi:hypothetical protein
VLGADIARKLFGSDDPVASFVTIEGITEMEVIGVLAAEEKSFISTVSEFDTTTNNTIFVPASTVERVGGSSYIYFLMGEAVSEDRIEDAKRQILSILTISHGKWEGKHEKFVIQEMGAILSLIDTTTTTITAFISIIAGIALLVAGIGIMNIMLVSVKERTREIGTRKALGARQATILNQFVVETLLLCGAGAGSTRPAAPRRWTPWRRCATSEPRHAPVVRWPHSLVPSARRRHGSGAAGEVRRIRVRDPEGLRGARGPGRCPVRAGGPREPGGRASPGRRVDPAALPG